MNYWKTLAVSAFLVPTMGVALQTEESGVEQVEFITSLGVEQVLVGNLIGSSVHGPVTGAHEEEVGAPARPGVAHGEDVVGTVDDVVLGMEGEIVGVVVSVGGFLGIGDRDVGVSWEAIDIQRDPENPDSYIVRTTLDRRLLEDAPALEHDRDGIF